jgi:predicted DNA-binding transcriptional regulator YafY
MMPDEPDVYAVVRRLLGLRDWLRTEAHDFPSIVAHMPSDYVDDENGRRQFRRDLRNLEALGHTIKRHQRPLRWSLSTSAHLLSDDDVQALVHIREGFSENHPLAPLVAGLLERLTGQLSEQQQAFWHRRPALRAPLNPAIDYGDCADLIRMLEQAISQRHQIAFQYRARGKNESLLHERLDPYEIEYTDRHFYLIAFSYRYGSILPFRIDRIVQDASQESPRPLSNIQQPRRERRPIVFTYRLPASFADGGVSERFTILSFTTDDQYVTIQASDPSEFRIVRTLLGYGEHAVLLDGPLSLLERMRKSVSLMYDNYKADI